MLRLTWTENALDDLDWWQKHDAKILRRIIQLCIDICKNPTQGRGKPEPLRFDLLGYWSRRINKEHRIIYTFDSKEVIIFSIEKMFLKFSIYNPMIQKLKAIKLNKLEI